MITFVTDTKEGETDLLGDTRKQPLVVLALDGSLITEIGPPLNGWTHEALENQANILSQKTRQGAEAFLGNTWVGSTEV